MTLSPARVCLACESFPCRCIRVPLVTTHYPRFEPCACGGTILAQSAASVFAAVQSHNASTGHAIWRAAR